MGVLAAVAFTVLLLKRRDLTLLAFDATHALAIGLNPKFLSALLLGLLAMTAVIALQVVGVVLVVAMLIIPGATAYLLTDRFGRMLVIAPLISVGCSVVGIYVSYWMDASSGGLVVVTQGIVFALVYLFSPRHGLVRHALRSRRPAQAPAAG